MYSVCLTLGGPQSHKLRQQIALQTSDGFCTTAQNFHRLISRAIIFSVFLTPLAEEIISSYIIQQNSHMHCNFKITKTNLHQ